MGERGRAEVGGKRAAGVGTEARGGRQEHASGVAPQKTINYVYDLAATDRPHTSSDHENRRQALTRRPNHQTQAHRAQTLDNHPRTRTHRTTRHPPNLEKIPRSLIRVPNACGRISQ